MGLAPVSRSFGFPAFSGLFPAFGGFLATLGGFLATLGGFLASRFLATLGGFFAAFSRCGLLNFCGRDFLGRRGLFGIRGGHGFFFCGLFAAS
ncbi:MAG: hypothetical protein J4F38_06150 [Pseudomonadales bacterium]|nr:hypothetical protein [Pseudomonadales bacterium]